MKWYGLLLDYKQLCGLECFADYAVQTVSPCVHVWLVTTEQLVVLPGL